MRDYSEGEFLADLNFLAGFGIEIGRPVPVSVPDDIDAEALADDIWADTVRRMADTVRALLPSMGRA